MYFQAVNQTKRTYVMVGVFLSCLRYINTSTACLGNIHKSKYPCAAQLGTHIVSL